MDSRRIVIRAFSKAYRPALGPTQLLIHRVPFGVLLGEADHHHVVARFGMSAALCFNGANWNDFPRTCHGSFNLLKTKRNLLYIRNQSVPLSKHFPPRL